MQMKGDFWCFIASTREFLKNLALILRPPLASLDKQHTFGEIYFHSELEFISFDWEHGVMENILMFYVPYI